jgi:hypothetical protein
MALKSLQTATFSVIRNCVPGVNGSQSPAPLAVLCILGPIPPATSPLLSLPAHGQAVWDYALFPSRRGLNLLEKKSTGVAGWLNQNSGKDVWLGVISKKSFYFILCMSYQSKYTF